MIGICVNHLQLSDSHVDHFLGVEELFVEVVLQVVHGCFCV